MSSNRNDASVCEHFFAQGKLTLYEISKLTDISYESVKYYNRKYKKFGSTARRSRSGRPTKMTQEMSLDIQLLVDQDKFTTSNKIKSTLSELHTGEISESSIQRELRNLGFKNILPKRVPGLKPSHIKNRLLWCEKYKKHAWNATVYSDETSIQLVQNTRKVWTQCPKNETVGFSKFQKKMFIWGAIYLEGRSKLEIIEGIMNAEMYRGILDRKLLTMAPMQCKKKYFFQQDNDAKHTSRLLKQFFIEKN